MGARKKWGKGATLSNDFSDLFLPSLIDFLTPVKALRENKNYQ